LSYGDESVIILLYHVVSKLETKGQGDTNKMVHKVKSHKVYKVNASISDFTTLRTLQTYYHAPHKTGTN